MAISVSVTVWHCHCPVCIPGPCCNTSLLCEIQSDVCPTPGRVLAFILLLLRNAVSLFCDPEIHLALTAPSATKCALCTSIHGHTHTHTRTNTHTHTHTHTHAHTHTHTHTQSSALTPGLCVESWRVTGLCGRHRSAMSQ